MKEVKKFQDFQDGQNILKFIMYNGCFKWQEIDDTLDEKAKNDELEDEDGILNLKTNTIPKGMVDMECIFDHDELMLNKRVVKEKEIKECYSYNLGANEDPKKVKVKKCAMHREGKICLNFLQSTRMSLLGAIKSSKIIILKSLQMTYY